MDRKGKETTEEERKIIVKLLTSGKSIKEVCSIVSRPRSTVRSILKRFEETNSYKNCLRTGRPSKLSEADKRKITRMVKKNPKTASSKIAATINEDLDITVHPRTVRRVLNEAGFNARVCRKKPCISNINKKKRLDFAKEHQSKNISFWEKVLFSDESKFNIYRSDGRILTWRKKNTELEHQNLQTTVKHGGGGVMVWGCMAAAGVGNLIFIDETMKKEDYLAILKTNLKASADSLCLGNDFYFQHDNDPKHTAEIVRLWLIYNVPHLLRTPPQSPDLNPIEHLWDLLDKKVRNHNITSKEQLKRVLSEEWLKIGADVTKKLVHSMPNRCQEVIKRKGLQTKY